MPNAAAPRPGEPTPVPRVVLCPYCGEVSRDPARCESCRGNFDPLSRQATQNSMGPWFIRDPAGPHRPGCSFEVLRGLVGRGKIEPSTVIRGPTTNQFWSPARRVPGVANLLGLCHNCGGPAGEDEVACLNCGATFRHHQDRQHLGLTEVRLLPGHASPEAIARGSAAELSLGSGSAPRPVAPRASAPAPGPVAQLRPGVAPGAGPGEGGRGVPRWVLVLAGMAVVGAVTAAAWIMGQLPGFPSPVLSGEIGREVIAPTAGTGLEALVNDGASGRAARAIEPPKAGGADAGEETEIAATPQTPPVQEDASAGGAGSRLGEINRLIAQGTEDSLRQAAKLGEEAGAGTEGAALGRAASRLLAQASLRRLP